MSYEPTGPHAAALNGTFAAQLVTTLQNDFQTREDTSFVTLSLRDSLYRGRFYGYYRFADGDSGLVAGTLYAPWRVEIHQFGYWPPLTYVSHIQRLYPSCDFPHLGPIYVLPGVLRGDTLAVNAQGKLPCTESTSGAPIERETQFGFAMVAIPQ